MNSYPDFREHGYEVLRELGRNREGGRITWLAAKVDTGEQMVIKQFCFAQAGSNWSGFEAHQREIKVLQGLTHPGIPRYINSFATSDGQLIGIFSLMVGSLTGYFALKREDSVSVAVRGVVGVFVGLVVGLATDWVISLAEDSFTTVLILLTLGFGASVGTGIIAGFLNPLILLALTGTSLPALSMLLYSPLKRRRLTTKYRHSEESLIKP